MDEGSGLMYSRTLNLEGAGGTGGFVVGGLGGGFEGAVEGVVADLRIRMDVE